MTPEAAILATIAAAHPAFRVCGDPVRTRLGWSVTIECKTAYDTVMDWFFVAEAYAIMFSYDVQNQALCTVTFREKSEWAK